MIGFSAGGDVSIDNAGGIYSYAVGQSPRITRPAVAVFGFAGNGNVAIDNSGIALAVSPLGAAAGIRAYGLTVDVANSGGVYAVSRDDLATGIDVYSIDSATVGNDGFIGAGSKYANAEGIYAIGGGDVSISNGALGEVVAYADGGIAIGVLGYSIAGNATVDSDGIVFARGLNGAIGVYAGAYGGATVTNSGAITAESEDGNATGISAYSVNGDASVANGGAIDVGAYSGNAIGIGGYAVAGDVHIDNAGSIYAVAFGNARGMFALSSDGSVNATNSGDIYAYSYAATSRAIAVEASGDAAVDNSGSIAAASAYGNAIGVSGFSYDGIVSISNSGDVAAVGGVDGQALGVLAYGYAAGVLNSGAITATGFSGAQGVLLAAYANGSVINEATGSITASAMTDAFGALVTSYAGVASINNAGSIDASTTDAGGLAAGVVAQGYAGVLVTNTNSGTISARSASGSDAIGVLARAYGNLLVDNAGLITATDDDYAVAVSLDSAEGIATLRNSGTLRTYSALESQIAVLGGDGVQQMLNYGDIHGAIVPPTALVIESSPSPKSVEWLMTCQTPASALTITSSPPPVTIAPWMAP